MSASVWIDADSCPLCVRNYVVQHCKKIGFSVFFVANKNIPCDFSPFSMIVCEKEKNAADNYIFDHCQKNDIVITKDFLLARRLLQKEVAVINDRGTEFTKENIQEFLSERDFDLQLAEIGITHHPKIGYDSKKFNLFCRCFEQVTRRFLPW